MDPDLNVNGGFVKRIALCTLLFALAAAVRLPAQSPPTAASAQEAPTAAGTQKAKHARKEKPSYAPPAPFSRLAVSAGISLMGVNMQAATNINPYFNLRATGNYFTYSVNNIKVAGSDGASGIDVSGNLNFATMGLALDYYPFPRHSWRLSPGLFLYNQNVISATGESTPGSSITLGSQTYYSDSTNPFAINARLGLNRRRQAFALTTGWGNMIPRTGGHWSFPFELGAVFTGTPVVNLDLSGYACTNFADAATNGPSCVNMATNPIAQSNLASQIAKYQSDLNPLTVYPIISFGVSYNFRIR